MYRVLLVDDEYHAIQGLQSGVNWAHLEIDAVHAAYNIRQAKELLEQHDIDLIICDVEMPEGSGIELLQWLREHHPMIEFLFLTCHSDFQYAQQAIQLGSMDYILKPVRYNELEIIVKKALKKIEDKRRQDQFKISYDHYYSLWKKHTPLLIERFWLDLLNRTVSSNPLEVNRVLRERNIHYTENSLFLPVLIGVQSWRKSLTQRDKKILEFALRNAAEHSFIAQQESGQVIQLSDELIVALVPQQEAKYDKSELRERCFTYIEFCNHSFQCDLSCYIGSPVLIHQMISAIEKLQAFHKNNVISRNREFFIEDYPQQWSQAVKSKDIGLSQMKDWAELLKQGNKGRLLEEVKQYLNQLKQDGRVSVQTLLNFYQDYCQVLYYVLQIKNLKVHEFTSNAFSPEQSLSVTRSIFELERWVEAATEIAISNIYQLEEGQSVIEKVKRYIAENIDQPLQRKDIADHVYLNQDYLAKLFKKETGLALTDYIVEERMKLARKMLGNSGTPIGTIASAVGYSSFSYFSKSFKNQFGVTPYEFREKVLCGGEE